MGGLLGPERVLNKSGMRCVDYYRPHAMGRQVAAVLVLMVAFIDSILTCSQVSDLGCGPGHISYGPINDGLLFISGVFLLGISAVIALDSWKLQVNQEDKADARI